MQPVDTEARGGGRIRKGSVGRVVATGRNDSLERPPATLIGAALWPLFAGVRPSFLTVCIVDDTSKIVREVKVASDLKLCCP